MAKVKKPTTEPAVTPHDSAEGGELVRANIHRRTETTADYVRIYANDMQAQTTPWDVRLIFGQISGTPTTNDPTLTVRQVGEVSMSPQFAKRVAVILLGQLEQYERTIGPIPLPEE
jgi:uncharacterized protein DUF3467